jgi:hypothetical protein
MYRTPPNGAAKRFMGALSRNERSRRFRALARVERELQIRKGNHASSRHIDRRAEPLGHRHTIDSLDIRGRQLGHVGDQSHHRIRSGRTWEWLRSKPKDPTPLMRPIAGVNVVGPLRRGVSDRGSLLGREVSALRRCQRSQRPFVGEVGSGLHNSSTI